MTVLKTIVPYWVSVTFWRGFRWVDTHGFRKIICCFERTSSSLRTSPSTASCPLMTATWKFQKDESQECVCQQPVGPTSGHSRYSHNDGHEKWLPCNSVVAFQIITIFSTSMIMGEEVREFPTKSSSFRFCIFVALLSSL